MCLYFCTIQYNFLFPCNSSDKITKLKCYRLRRRIQGVFAWKESQQPHPQAKPENAPPSTWGQEDWFDTLCWSPKQAKWWHSGLSPRWWLPGPAAATSTSSLSISVLVCCRMPGSSTIIPPKFLVFGKQQVNALRKRDVKWQKFSKSPCFSACSIYFMLSCGSSRISPCLEDGKQ